MRQWLPKHDSQSRMTTKFFIFGWLCSCIVLHKHTTHIEAKPFCTNSLSILCAKSEVITIYFVISWRYIPVRVWTPLVGDRRSGEWGIILITCPHRNQCISQAVGWPTSKPWLSSRSWFSKKSIGDLEPDLAFLQEVCTNLLPGLLLTFVHLSALQHFAHQHRHQPLFFLNLPIQICGHFFVPTLVLPIDRHALHWCRPGASRCGPWWRWKHFSWRPHPCGR